VLPLTHAPAWIAASVTLIVVVLYLGLAPLSLPPAPTNFDKVEHAFAYACLAVWFTGLVTRRHYGLVALGLAVLGLTIELLQDAMPFGRQGDPWDMVANVTGIFLGLVLAAWVTGGWALKAEAWLNRN
jgi:VanZ family protein